MILTLDEIKGKTFYLRELKADPWIKKRRFEFTTDGFGPSIDKHGLPVTGLTEDGTALNKKGNKEQIKGTRKVLEEALGMEEGDLRKGTLKKPSDFWVKYSVPLRGEDRPLSGDDPSDQLDILFAAAQSCCAFGTKNRKAKSEYLLYTKEDAAKSANETKKVKREAYRLFEALTLDERIDILEMLGVKAKSLTAEVIEDRLTDELEDSTAKFLAIVKDPKRSQKTYVRHCLDKGLLHMQDGVILYGETVLGHDVNSAADTLFSDEQAKTREALKLQK